MKRQQNPDIISNIIKRGSTLNIKHFYNTLEDDISNKDHDNKSRLTPMSKGGLSLHLKIYLFSCRMWK